MKFLVTVSFFLIVLLAFAKGKGFSWLLFDEVDLDNPVTRAIIMDFPPTTIGRDVSEGTDPVPVRGPLEHIGIPVTRVGIFEQPATTPPTYPTPPISPDTPPYATTTAVPEATPYSKN